VPKELLKAENRLPELAKMLGRRTSALRQYLVKRKSRDFVYLRRHMKPAAARRVKALDLPGVFLQREYQRYYPAGEAAAQLVGITNIDGQGQEGMELALNSLLQGQSGERTVIEDRLGRVVDDLSDYKPAKPGQDVRLSIDLRLQYLAYRDLKEAVAKRHAKSGVAVVINPNTGEVLAMANVPSYNPNRRTDMNPARMRNRAETDVFEPGSSIKPLLISKALMSGKFDTHSIIHTGDGWTMVAGHTIQDDGAYGAINLATLLKKSSNVGAAKVGLALGPEAVWNMYSDFGLVKRTGSGFPGESDGLLRFYRRWNKFETATASFGYGVSVTALQLARAYCAIADNGVLRPVSLLERDKPMPGHRIMPASVAWQIRQFLEGVVEPGGTGTRAALDNYVVAGKTGTAHRSMAGAYLAHRYNAVFAGMVPARHPKLVTVVVIKDPQGKAYFGGLVAAPVFRRIMRGATRLLQIPPGVNSTLTASAEPGGGSPS
jgi:cell division protein FtsI (penicillin-binding protein 3)